MATQGRHTPNSCDYSKPHTSRSHPYEHVDMYAWGKDGKTVTASHHGLDVRGHAGEAYLGRAHASRGR